MVIRDDSNRTMHDKKVINKNGVRKNYARSGLDLIISESGSSIVSSFFSLPLPFNLRYKSPLPAAYVVEKSPNLIPQYSGLIFLL